MKHLSETIVAYLEQDKPLILVSVLASSGSTPRGAGAMMLVSENGRIQGTIGGGAVEHTAELHAMELLKKGYSDMVGYCLNKNDVANLGMVCGGDVTVYFQYLHGEKDLLLFRCLFQSCSRNEDAWLIRKFEKQTATAMAVYGRKGLLIGDALEDATLAGLRKPGAVYRPGEPAYYSLPVSCSGRVCIFGGGHVSQELAPVLAHIGFSVTVFEDREAFADPALFPGVDKVILGDFKNIAASLSLTEKDYAVIMTRGHQADFEVLAQILKLPLAYIGCIGSRSKIAATKQRLTDMGFPENIYDRVHSPIGLEIMAETPAEIAISIAAELIRHRALAVPH